MQEAHAGSGPIARELLCCLSLCSAGEDATMPEASSHHLALYSRSLCCHVRSASTSIALYYLVTGLRRRSLFLRGFNALYAAHSPLARLPQSPCLCCSTAVFFVALDLHTMYKLIDFKSSFDVNKPVSWLWESNGGAFVCRIKPEIEM